MGAAAVLGNTGYMGLPLVAAAFGQGAAVPLALGLTLEVTVIIPLTIALVEGSKGLASGWAGIAASVAAALARNPLMVAIFSGALVAASGLGLPTPIERFTGLLGDAAGPCALFTLGATLASQRLSSGLPEVSYMSGFKLFAHPAAIWLTTVLFDVDPLWASVAILGASLPVAANVFILARQYDTYVERVSSAILLSTAVSVVTVSALLTLLPLQ
jgi:predicted permease